MPTHVVVIGAGAVGLASAYWLLSDGAKVTVLERDQVASGSSGLSVGIVETQYLDPVAIEMRVISRRFFDKLVADHNLVFNQNGYLRAARDAATLESFHRSAEAQQALGVHDAHVLDQADLRRLVPDLRVDDLAGGLFGPSDGYVDPHEACAILASEVRGLGGRILARTPLRDARRTSQGHQLDAGDEQLCCDVVVNAAGPWATPVGAVLGAPVEVVAQRRQAVIAHLPRPSRAILPSFMDYTPGEGRLGLYLRPEGPAQDGRLVCGMHSEEIIDPPADPDNYPHRNDVEFLEDVATALSERLLDGAEARLGEGWSGLYPVPAGAMALIGPHPADASIVCACGLGGSGLQSAPAAGRLVADWVLRGAPQQIPAAIVYRPTGGQS